jgi:hypothetical protein
MRSSHRTGGAAVSRAPSWILVARGAIFIAAAAFIIGGPLARQVLGVKSAIARPWGMYGGFARDICAVELRERRPDGSERRLDRLSLLGYARPRDAPATVRRVTSAETARQQASTVCAALGPGRDVRLHLRCAERRGSGWSGIEAGEANRCVPRDTR